MVKSASRKPANTAAAPESDEALSPKEQRKLARQAAKARQALINFTLGSFAGCAFLGLLLSLVLDPKLGVAAAFGLLCLVLSFKYPRHAIYAFVLYMPFSGTVTYALGGSSILQLAKDAFYIPALIAVFQFCRTQRLPFLLPKGISIPLWILLTSSTMTLLLVNLPQHLNGNGEAQQILMEMNGNASEQPILMGIWGLKVLLGYLPLITCIYYLIRTREDMYLLLRMQVVVILVCCGLAFIQYLLLRTGRCEGTTGVGGELFRASLDARCFVGGSLLYTPEHGQVRLPGTFVAPWQWGWFLISAAFFAFGTTFNDRNLLWRGVGIASLLGVLMMSVLSGQRIALALVPVNLGILLILTGQIAKLKRLVPIGVVMFFLISFLIARDPGAVQERLDSFQNRWEASPPTAFISQQIQWAIDQQQGFLGRGVGRATNSARMFGETELVETYHSKVLYELGPLGLASTLALYTVLTLITFRAYRKIKNPDLRGYGASMWVFVLFISYFPYYYPLDVDPVAVYYWMAAGIVLKLPEIDQQEQLKEKLKSQGQDALSSRQLKKMQKNSAGFS